MTPPAVAIEEVRVSTILAVVYGANTIDLHGHIGAT